MSVQATAPTTPTTAAAVTCCHVSLILSKLSFPPSEQPQHTNLKKLSPFR